ncbi:transcriptional regulator [Nocardioides gansuensis]|uniref:Transcriptional regulator n=1 Tax=Nocardioides gansuensis TaxID=2138300 RepID=A0A2T8FCI6_9ACTN|nr:helix-turn-helix domain-containing protein [Nocardioides gansuensis]PVG83420.1 transcriptional regulator [Nocardioides gansuensis]
MADDAERQAISALRAVAHPVRLRILSLLTAEAMSAAEVARALDLTHANASYHLRVLHEAGELVEAGEERIRGGVARRYRYPVGGDPARRPKGPAAPEDRVAWASATHAEVVRRLASASRERHPGSDSDLETWVEPDVWARAMGLVQEAVLLLHAEARPARTEGTIHVSATTLAFVMADDQ